MPNENNSDEEIQSDFQSGSENSSNDNNGNDKALENIKGDLNLKVAKKKEGKIYYDTSNTIAENEKNIHNNDHVQFNDVMKAFTGQVTETEKTQLGKAIKTFTQSKEKNKVEIKFNDTTDKVLERTTNYATLSNEITKYQPKVKANREADIVDYTTDQISIAKKSAKQIASSYKEETTMEKNIKQMLIKNHCDKEEEMIKEENAQMLQLTPEEIEKRHNDLKKIRSLLFQNGIKNQRQGKIKSKLYHKINKKRQEKEEMEIFKQLEEIDPEAVREYLDKKKKDRIQERMDLKHSFNSKFSKTVKRYHLTQDNNVKEAIKENFQLRDKLLQKIKGVEDDDNEEIEEEGDDENEENEEDNGNEKGNEEEENIDANYLLINFEEKKEKKTKNNDKLHKPEDSGVFSMKFMQKSNDNNEMKQKIKNVLNDINCDEDYEEEENDDKSSSDSEIKPQNKDKNKVKMADSSINKHKPTVITNEDINKISKEASKILSSSNQGDKDAKVNLSKEDLAQILAEDNIAKDINEFNSFLIENNTNKQEFLEGEKQASNEAIRQKNTPYLSGWGDWTGETKQLKAKEFLKKKRYEDKIKRLQLIQNEDITQNPYIKVNNSFDKNFSNYLVKELPLNVSNREQFDKLNSHSIGREWNSLTMYKKMIQPSIIKKIGQIIEPMKVNDSTSAKKLCDIIEKATKKKQRTKSKL